MGIPKDGLQNLTNTLEGDKDLNSPRELSAEAEKELAIVEKTIQEAHVDRVNPELKCILVILPSRHSPTGILMQREDVILEWIFLPHKPNKKLKTYIEKISDLIHKEDCVMSIFVWVMTAVLKYRDPKRVQDGVFRKSTLTSLKHHIYSSDVMFDLLSSNPVTKITNGGEANQNESKYGGGALQTPPLLEELLAIESCLGKEKSFENVLIGAMDSSSGPLACA
ncbi:hypothetical protein STEG23_028764 [Scotinomys teguina]